jgi:toxin ParE1/3/4
VKLIALHPDADAEVSEAARYYESREPGLGSDLLGEVERALDQILTNPEASQKIGRRVRRKPLWRFPYNLVYAVYAERIRIVAFAHQKRRPFYWQERLKNLAEREGRTRP